MSHPHSHHDHAHDHHHVHAVASSGLRAAFLINLAFTMVEFGGGFWSESMAVLSNALHDLGDCLVLGAAWYLQRVAARGRDERYSYGYARYSMLGGWLSAVVLIVGCIGIIALAIPRLLHPQLPETTSMMGFAVFGITANALAAWRLHGGGTLNERGAYLHFLEDVLGWAAVLVGGAVLHFTGWAWIDPALSIGISFYILFNAARTFRIGTRILMQSHPTAVDPLAVDHALRGIVGVSDVHDQHTWSLDGHYTVLTVHLVTSASAEAAQVKRDARAALKMLGIQHATIELETPDETCELQHH